MIECSEYKFGIVFILDALGAKGFTNEQIKTFLSARSNLIKIIQDHHDHELAKENKLMKPNTFTFGDTIIITIELNNEEFYMRHTALALMMMQNYMFFSLKERILFRGAFSIGSYVEDSSSNTVMGESVSDAASWYESSEWMGLSSTPKTNNFLEYYFPEGSLDKHKFYFLYPVPLKNGSTIDLYTISWAGRFFHTDPDISDPQKDFLECLVNYPVPYGAERKIENTKKYFTYVKNKINS